MTETQTAAHEVRFAPRGNDPYRVECSCGWDATSFSMAASPARNVANIRRTGQAHIRATRSKAAACSRCGGTDNVGPLPKQFPCESCGQRGLCYACNVNHNLWCTA